jgi:hypothetical protein
MTETRRREVVSELCRDAGLPVAPGLDPSPAESLSETETQQHERDEAIPFTSPLCASDLARLLRQGGFRNATNNAVEVFLRQYRRKYEDSYIDVDSDDRRRNTPRFLYRPEVWEHLVQHFSRVAR